MHLRAAKSGPPKEKNGFHKLPAFNFIYFCCVKFHRRENHLQITQKIHFSFIFLVLIFVFEQSCSNAPAGETPRQWCKTKVDSSWNVLTQIRASYVFDMNEYVQRRQEIDSIVNLIEKNGLNKMPEMLKSDFVKYKSISGLYKPLANAYKDEVLKSENLFYELRVLERSVNNGEYDNRVSDFKVLIAELNKKLAENSSKSNELMNKLNTIEPLYHRVSESVGKWMTETGL